MIKIYPYIEVLDTTDTKPIENLIEEWRKTSGSDIRLFYEFFDDEELFWVRAYMKEDRHFRELENLFFFVCENSDLSLHLDWDDTPDGTTEFELRYLDRPSGAADPVPENRNIA